VPNYSDYSESNELFPRTTIYRSIVRDLIGDSPVWYFLEKAIINAQPSPARRDRVGGRRQSSQQPAPTKQTPTGTVTLQLIALNELFEVAYFTELLHNITTNVPGYDVSKYNTTHVTETIKAIMKVRISCAL